MKFNSIKTLHRFIAGLAVVCLLAMTPLAHAAKAVIISTGSGYLMGGFAGDGAPKAEIPSSAFMPEGEVTDWNKFEAAIGQIYQQLGVNPKDQSVLVTDSASNQKSHREKLTQTLFEKFNVPAFYLHYTAGFEAYAAGLQTALIVRMEEGLTQFAVVRDGQISLATRNNLMGKRMAEEKTPSDPLKALFQPDSATGVFGIPESVHNTIMNIEHEQQRGPLYSNILITGEGSLYKDLRDRLTDNVTLFAPSTAKVNVHALPDRRMLGWKGASKVVGEGMFESLWIKRAEYDQSGPEIIGRKMF